RTPAWESAVGGGSRTCAHPSLHRTLAHTHQTLQRSSGFLTSFAVALQLKAAANSGMFTTTPLMRTGGGECGSTMAFTRWFSGRSFEQAHCAKPTKKRCAGVR